LDPAFLPFRLPFSISRLAMPASSVPAVVPLGVYQLGTITIATLPGEFTTVMGRRIAASVERALPTPPQRVLLVGLANEYVSYFATPEEYEAQHYEGASTLYGQDAAPLVEYELTRLAHGLSGSGSEPQRTFRYCPGPQHSFTLYDAGAPPHSPDEGLAELLEDATTGLPVRNSPWFCWEDRLPTLPSRNDTAERVTPRVTLERQDGGGTWSPVVIDGTEETDDGIDFVTIAYANDAHRSIWCSIWMPPAERDSLTTLRFHVATLHNDELCSKPFPGTGAPSQDAVPCVVR
jgi:neutral ceramidase